MVNRRMLIVVVLLVLAAAWGGLTRLDVDTDLVHSLPDNDRVLADALAVFAHHPAHDRVAVDIMIRGGRVDVLAECADFLEDRMRHSGLFGQVGFDRAAGLVPELAVYAASRLPLLLSEQDLRRLADRLQPDAVRKRFQEMSIALSTLEGIGRARLFALDPLGLAEPVMEKMAALIPAGDARLYRGHLLSADGEHMLVSGIPAVSTSDTSSAAAIAELIGRAGAELERRYRPQGIEVVLTPVGAYRAALDNERIIRRDVQLALVLATVGIGLLLLISFPRPLMGLLSLVPAVAGTAAALFTYSLFKDSISVMVLGFGGAVISITVDQGIAYMLFLDRPRQTEGRKAAHEVRAVGIMAVVTSIGAFLLLGSSGFPVFTELGWFAALGILFSALFVHLIMPRIFPKVPPGSRRRLFLPVLADRLYTTGRTGFLAALILCFCLLPFAAPRFHVSLDSMNTVSRETGAADKLVLDTWGGMENRVLLMLAASSRSALQQQNDRIVQQVERDLDQGLLCRAFVPSMLFPGPERARDNLSAWKSFWTPDRVAEVEKTLAAAAAEYGFSMQGFASFSAGLRGDVSLDAPELPEKYFSLFGISRDDVSGKLIEFISLVPGDGYRADLLFQHYRSEGRLFDGACFSDHLAGILFTVFTRMLLILGCGLALLLLLFYLDFRLTLITLAPVIFAYICTLGTLRLVDHPLDIPALMLSIIILGMGIDYSIFCVRAHQRYRDIGHPSYTLVRYCVFLAGASTLIGFGVLCFADHSLLRSIGLTSFTGIGYSLLGTCLLLPPLLDRYFSDRSNPEVQPDGKESPEIRVRRRYRLMETYPRLFARCKLRLDPMFRELPEQLAGVERSQVQSIFDVGCGYGVPACWCAEYFPRAVVYGIDPDPERVRVASLALGDRGRIVIGAAPRLPESAAKAELVLLLDMLHYLDDATLHELLVNCRSALDTQGRLLIRAVIRPSAQPSWSWKWEDLRIRVQGGTPHYRSPEQLAERLARAGFSAITHRVTPTNSELIWLCGRTGNDHAN
jgi:predicted exporter/SAM-dependent methyltransferase